MRFRRFTQATLIPPAIFVDLVHHTPGQAQTVTQASSIDSWHTEADIVPSRIQTGFDLFFKSGYTNHLPAMIPVAMVYATPEDSAAELAYLEKRGFPISCVEMEKNQTGNSCCRRITWRYTCNGQQRCIAWIQN
jgi:hypothetical protein